MEERLSWHVYTDILTKKGEAKKIRISFAFDSLREAKLLAKALNKCMRKAGDTVKPFYAGKET